MEQSKNGRYEPECPLTHDWVNRLAALIGNCDLAIEKISTDSPLLRQLLLIRNIADGMAKELNQFQCELAHVRIVNGKTTSIV